MKLKTLFIAIICLLPLTAQASPYALLQNELNHRLPANTQWALTVADCATGTTSGIGAAETPLTPASILKLVTTGAVLADGLTDWRGAELLSNASIKDGVLAGNLYLRGTGNALLTSNELSKAVAELYRNGLRRIDGDLVVDDTLFHNNELTRIRKGPAYALPGALGLDLHTVAVTATPGNLGQSPHVRIEPPNAQVRFAITARTTGGGATTLTVEQLDDFSYKVSGNLPDTAGSIKQRFALNAPARYAGESLRILLKEAGIELTGRVATKATPATAKVLVTIPGPPIPELLRDMNTHSLNVVADNLFLLLGARKYGAPGTRSKGIKVLTALLAEIGLPVNQVSIVDGSGLDKNNKISTDVMARYLAALTKVEWFETLKNSLPRAGYEGTVKHLAYQDERFRIKSGRLEDIYALAGYGVDATGKEIAFAFIVNGKGAGILPHLETIGSDVLRFIAQMKY